MGTISRSIKHKILEIYNKSLFREHFIVDLDLRTSGIQLEKRSFMNLEITLFVKDKNMDFKSVLLKDKIKKILKSIYHDDLTTSEYFTLHTTKRLKV